MKSRFFSGQKSRGSILEAGLWSGPIVKVTCIENNPDNSNLTVKRVSIGGSSVSSLKTDEVLMTDSLMSCYGFIVIATKKDDPNNATVVGLSHWIGDEYGAKDTVLDLKKMVLESLGCNFESEASFYCIAVGGGANCYAAEQLSDQVKKITKSKEYPNNIFDEAICDTNKGSDLKSTSLFIQKINGEIEITYHTFSMEQLLEQQRETEQDITPQTGTPLR
jgi:hypothetical protein